MKYQKLIYVLVLFAHNANFSSNTTTHVPKSSAFSKLLKDCSPEELQERAQYAAINRIFKEIEQINFPISHVGPKLSQIFNFPLFKNLTSVTVYGIIFEKDVIGNKTIWFQKPNDPTQMQPEDLKRSQDLADKITNYMAAPRVSGKRRTRE